MNRRDPVRLRIDPAPRFSPQCLEGEEPHERRARQQLARESRLREVSSDPTKATDAAEAKSAIAQAAKPLHQQIKDAREQYPEDDDLLDLDAAHQAFANSFGDASDTDADAGDDTVTESRRPRAKFSLNCLE